jgi:peptide/nickel transport system permease protein
MNRLVVQYVLRRLGTSLLVLLGAITITFVISHLIPVNPIIVWLGRGANLQLIGIYEKTYHLADPLYVQYFYYVYGLLHLQLGFSPSRHEPVTTVISQSLPFTLQLIFFSVIVTAVLGLVGGILSAKYAGRIPEKIVKVTYITSTAAPPFLVPIVILILFAIVVHVLPTSGPIGSMALPSPITGIPIIDAILEQDWSALGSLIQHALLPSLAISLSLYGFLTRILSSSIGEVFQSGYVRAAKARGVTENILLIKYGLKNSLVPVITILSLILTFTLVNDAFVETIFGYPGVGQLAVQAIESFDYPVILATTLVYAVIIVVTNLVADMLYFAVDPRVKLA